MSPSATHPAGASQQPGKEQASGEALEAPHRWQAEDSEQMPPGEAAHHGRSSAEAAEGETQCYDVLHRPLSDCRRAVASEAQGAGAASGQPEAQLDASSGAPGPSTSGAPSSGAFHPISDTPPGLDDLYDMIWDKDKMDEEVHKTTTTTTTTMMTMRCTRR